MKIIEAEWFVGNDENFLQVAEILNEQIKLKNLKGF